MSPRQDRRVQADATGESANRYEHETLAVVFQVREGAVHVLLWRRALEPFAPSVATYNDLLGREQP